MKTFKEYLEMAAHATYKGANKRLGLISDMQYLGVLAFNDMKTFEKSVDLKIRDAKPKEKIIEKTLRIHLEDRIKKYITNNASNHEVVRGLYEKDLVLLKNRYEKRGWEALTWNIYLPKNSDTVDFHIKLKESKDE